MKPVRRITKAFMALSVAALFGSTTAEAGPDCAAVFDATYPNSQTQALANCQTCHQSSGGGGNYNVYGLDLRDNGALGAGFSCSVGDFVAALRAVESFDSDGEGSMNLVEIEANAQPGWCVATSGSGCNNAVGAPPDISLDPVAANTAPVAVVGGPYMGEAGTTEIQFDGSGSSDADDDALSFAWNFGDGGTATGMTPTYTYLAAGNFEVRLVVDDGKTNSEPSVTSATISAPPMNLAPTANPGGPYNGEPGQPIEFSGAASSDPNNDELVYSWDFGDGAMGSGVSLTHAFAADGTYTIALTVSDGQATNTASTTATISTAPANRAPTADAGGPYAGDMGATISFSAATSSDPDNDTLNYRWDFGDGTTATGVAPGHAYNEAGNYRVTLIVNDGELDSAPAITTAEIIVRAAGSDGALLYQENCAFCHGEPWSGPSVDESLPGIRRVTGARACNISGSIFGTSIFPNGVPDMQFLQGLLETEISAIAEYLNSEESSGEQRYITTCAGCHGNNGSGGRVGEDVHGDSAGETLEAIAEESEMRYLACMPESDIIAIADFLMTMDDDNDDDGIGDDEDEDDDNDGIADDDDSDDDNDGVSDDDESDNGTDPRDDDSDDDDVNDGDEREDGTDPLDSDTDDDGLDDGEERDRGTDPKDHDSDDDGVSDGDEVKLFGTNPLIADGVADQRDSGGGSTDLPLLVLLAAMALMYRKPRAFRRA